MNKRYWWVIITYVIMQLSGIVGGPLFYFLFPIDKTQAIVYYTIFSFIAGVVVFLLLMRPEMKRGSNKDASPLGSTILWMVAGVFMAIFAQGIAGYIEQNILGISSQSENTQNILEIARAFPMFTIIPALFAPILEEILFRKIIFGGLYVRTNFWIAALVSSLIFAIIHMDPTHLLVYASMGITFAYLYVKTKRIIVPIAVHMGMNTAVVLTQLLLKPEDLERIQKNMNFIWLQFIGG